MDDWEEEEQIAPIDLKTKDLPKSKWDDEDVDENDVKESWEDEDEPASAPAAPSVKTTEKAPKKPSEKATEKKGKNVEPLDPVAEKLRQQRLVEESDFKSTKELFGGARDEKNLDTFIPKSESDFLEYAELIADRIRPFEKSFHYMGLLKAIMRLSMASLKGADAKDIASSITAIANEKIKAEKEANAAGKKKGGKKKQLNVDKPDEDFVPADQYDALDDYDFM